MPEIRNNVERGTPYSQYEYVDVVFNSTADADTIILHNLRVANPNDVDYQVVRASQACQVYENVGLDARPWTKRDIVLRCTVSSARVTLLLTTRS